MTGGWTALSVIADAQVGVYMLVVWTEFDTGKAARRLVKKRQIGQAHRLHDDSTGQPMNRTAFIGTYCASDEGISNGRELSR